MFELLLGCILLAQSIGLVLLWKSRHQVKKDNLTIEQINQIIDISRQPPTDLHPIQKKIDELPNKVLLSITNSTNTYKGALGELIGYISLRASYDRIIPLGSIMDFLAIKLPTTESDGYIDFVDIKTGHKARLSKEQRAVQKLIKEKKINFCHFKVEASDADYSKRD